MPTRAIYIELFAEWQEGHAGAQVFVYAGDGTQLAQLFHDEQKTIPATNPQTLDTLVDECGCRYGKWVQPVYVDASAYRVETSTGLVTGIVRSGLTSLEGEDASKAKVRARGGLVDVPLEDFLAREIFVENVGRLGSIAADNSQIIAQAVAQAAAQAGGVVVLPARTIPWNGVSLPARVMLRGQGINATKLESQKGSATVEITGADAGLADLTLNGVSRIAMSAGILTKRQDRLRLTNVRLRNFATGLDARGGRGHRFDQLFADENVKGAELVGNLEDGSIADVRWSGGSAEGNTEVGVRIRQVERAARSIVLEGVSFKENILGLSIRGGQVLTIEGCRWNGNSNDFEVEDNDDIGQLQRVRALELLRCRFPDKGQGSFQGTCRDVLLRRCVFEGDYTMPLTAVDFSIILEDCVERGSVNTTGRVTKVQRVGSRYRGYSQVETGGAQPVATEAWSLPLIPGQRVVLTARVAAIGLNNDNAAYYVIHGALRRQPAQLFVDSQSGNFALGEVITGQTSGATARVVKRVASGNSSVLDVIEVVGEFIDNEVLLGDLGAQGLVDGQLSERDVQVVGQVKALTQESASGMDANFNASVSSAIVEVLGIANNTFLWQVDVDGLVSD